MSRNLKLGGDCNDKCGGQGLIQGSPSNIKVSGFYGSNKNEKFFGVQWEQIQPPRVWMVLFLATHTEFALTREIMG